MAFIPLSNFNGLFEGYTNFFPNIEKFSAYEKEVEIEEKTFNNAYGRENQKLYTKTPELETRNKIFDLNTQLAIKTIETSILNGDDFDEILDYAVARRALCAYQMDTPNEDSFARSRIGSINPFETPLVGKIRSDCIVQMIERMVNGITVEIIDGEMVEGQIPIGHFSFEGSEYYRDRGPDNGNLELLIDGKKAAFFAGSKIVYSDIDYSYCLDGNGFGCIYYIEDDGPDQEYMDKLNSLFQDGDISSLHWHMCIKTPVKRGGGAIAEWICAGLMRSKGIDFQDWIGNYDMWSIAITSGLGRFTEIYPTLVMV